MEHSIFSPSSAHRWVNCPASVREEAKYPDTTNIHAETGSKAHQYAADYISGKIEASDIPSEMWRYIKGYYEYISEIGYNSDIACIEQRLSFSDYVLRGFGTIDFYCVTGDTAIICDFKYGMIPVYAANNHQLLLYAAAVLQKHQHVEIFKLVIYQPRATNMSESNRPIHEWEINREDLLIKLKYFTKQALLALSEDPLYNPGGHCYYCKHQVFCRAFSEKILSNKELIFSNDELTLEEHRELLKHASLIRKLLTSLEDLYRDKLESGEEIDGMSLREGRTVRTWKDDILEELEQSHPELIEVTKKPISITKATNLIDPDIMENFISRKQYKPSIIIETK